MKRKTFSILKMYPDQTIQSIQTYGDYLKMYYKIINYFSDYEAVVRHSLYDETAFKNEEIN